MPDDPSAGWDAVAATFAALRSPVGTDIVKRWSAHLRPAGTVIDIGCGTGFPISTTLVDEGFDAFGIDPSPTLLAAFRRNIPGAKTACEAAQVSRFFGRQFDGAIAIGLVFLLPEDDQQNLIKSVAQALNPGGHFLFSAPRQPCVWNDTLTGRLSVSLGEARYRQLLAAAGLRLVADYVDEGANHYLHAASAPGQHRQGSTLG